MGKKPGKVEKMDCGKCFYFEADNDYTLGGICRFNPPVCDERGWIWPRVTKAASYENKNGKIIHVVKGDWCGMFKESQE